MRAPMLRAALPFMAGIMLARWLPYGPVPWWVLLVAMLLLQVRAVWWRLSFAGRWLPGAAVLAFWCAGGALWQQLNDPLRAGDIGRHAEAGGGTWLAELRSVTNVPGRTLRGELRILGVHRDGETTPARGRLLATLMLDGQAKVPAVGDRLWLDAVPRAIDRAPDPGGFDRRQWAASRGVGHEVFAGADRWIAIPGGGHWTDVFHPMRDRVADWLVASGLPTRERAIVKALVLGSRNELDDTQKAAFARSGTMHVLAVSGMHVGLIYAVFATLFAWMGQRRNARWLRGLLLLVVLWSYAGLTGASPSVMRASFMFSCFALAGMLGRRPEALNTLATAALVLLLIDPLMLGQLSFQFSFLAVLGIVLFYDPLHRLWLPEGRLMRYA